MRDLNEAETSFRVNYSGLSTSLTQRPNATTSAASPSSHRKSETPGLSHSPSSLRPVIANQLLNSLHTSLFGPSPLLLLTVATISFQALTAFFFLPCI